MWREWAILGLNILIKFKFIFLDYWGCFKLKYFVLGMMEELALDNDLICKQNFLIFNGCKLHKDGWVDTLKLEVLNCVL